MIKIGNKQINYATIHFVESKTHNKEKLILYIYYETISSESLHPKSEHIYIYIKSYYTS